MIAAKKMLLAGRGLPLVPVMTSATAPSGTVARSSYFGGGFGEAWKVFAATAPSFVGGSQGNADQFAFGRTGTNGSLPHWLSYDFGSGIAPQIRSIDFASYNEGSADAETRIFRVEGSNDNSTWTGTRDFEHPKDQARVLRYNFAAIGRFRYWRIRVISVWGASENTSLIQKIQFYGSR